MRNLFKNKTILVTGGAGSIGKRIIHHLLPYQPKAVRSFDNSEYGQFQLSQELKAYEASMRYLMGDVRDPARLRKAMEGVDYVFHGSALKHVPLCEYNPFEAVGTNVVGTQNVLDAAIHEDVDVVINISTDKAINPTSAMGATKMLAERLTTSSFYSTGKHRTRCASVRFGNVINSNGSVIPTFLSQIEKGGPVTITDARMTRFMISTDQAVELIFRTVEHTRGGEIFILKMPVLRIKDLAEELIALYHQFSGKPKRTIPIKVVGMRVGEKLTEELMTETESERVVELPDMYIILPQQQFEGTALYRKKHPATGRSRSLPFKPLQPMSRPQLRDLLIETVFENEAMFRKSPRAGAQVRQK